MEGKLLGLKPDGAQALCSWGLPWARALTSPVQWVLAIPAGGEGWLRSTHSQGGQQQHDKHALGLPAQIPGPQPRPGHRLPPTVPAAIPRAAHSSGERGPAACPGLHVSPCQSTQVTTVWPGLGMGRVSGPPGGGVGDEYSPQHEDQTCSRALTHWEGAFNCQLHGNRRHREAEEPKQ